MSQARKVANIAGGITCAVCVGWVVHRMTSTHVFAQLTTAPDARHWWIQVTGGALLYALSTVLLGIAWYALLRALGASGVPASRTLTIYSVSQFGKYLPGSVLQYLGRHAMLRAHGVSHRLLVLCALLEAALLVGAALIWAAPLAVHYVPFNAPTIWVVVAAGLAFAGWLLHRYAPMLGGGIEASPRWLMFAFALHLVFFGTMGMTFRVVAGAEIFATTGWLAIFAGVAASWIAGFVVVGAPAGVGVREAVFLALFGAALGEQVTLTSVSAFRLATFGGDLLVFLLALPFAAAARRVRGAA